MAASFAYVQGTFKDSQGVALAGAKVYFRPLDTPKASGGDIVTTTYPSVILDGAGKFGFAPTFALVAGSYLVIITDRDTFAITVPGDGLTHAIESLSVDIGDVEKYLHRTDLDIAALSLALKDSQTIKHSRKGSVSAVRHRFCVVGEMDNITAMDDLASLISKNLPVEVIAFNMNPPAGSAATIDGNIGKHFHSWIKNYPGIYGPGSGGDNHFWYALGASDWAPGNVTAVTNFLTLPGNERYYSIVIGDVTLFVLDSNNSEPDGNASNSTQAAWLNVQVASSVTRWNIVVFRDAPFASKNGYSFPPMNWAFNAMNIHAIICGGPRFYERLVYGTTPMFVVGSTANVLDSFGTPVADSKYRYNTFKGALFFDVNENSINFWFNDRYGNILDAFVITGQDTAQISSRVSVGQGLTVVSSGVAVSYGVANDQVPPGGMTNVWKNLTGRVIQATGVPSDAEVYANPWIKECLVLVGDNPAVLWYWNRQLKAWNIFASSSQAEIPYFSQLPKLATVTFTPLGGQSATTVVHLSHTVPGAAIYYALDEAPFQLLSSTDDRVFIGSKGKKVVVSAYATHANYVDSDVYWQEY